ncbi:BglG family transcription antiterminator [Erysipelatoclostridium sp. AM42-17]|uniref:BglG family transcription antiterminator n=1 Tax=Erysipelatoclostridium sp. AM42-17 TaxID=2293102 RepID=UPI000E5230BB|nr:PRD domain-containing protein [Erysipelatoclostridium sp. AM42-17]RHS92569.1 PRD domain-containing protein [Erysipelatoclostridium sp. AM42-17]
MTLAIHSNENFDLTKQQITHDIRQVIEDRHLFLSTNSINNLAIHLTIAVIRIKSDNYIPLSQGQVEYYRDNDNFKYALDLCSMLEKKYDIQFPESEVALVSMYLSKNKALDIELNPGFDLLDEDVAVILRETMQRIKDEKDLNFKDDDKLFVSIGLHLTPALERLQNDSQIDNPLVDKIKERHQFEFSLASILNDVVEEKYQKRFTDDEIAYIALHFVVSTSKLKGHLD